MAEATLRMEGGIAGFAVRLGHRGSSGRSEGFVPASGYRTHGHLAPTGYAGRTPGVITSRQGIYRAGLGPMSRAFKRNAPRTQ
jgi:hypothetical protein